MSYSTPRKQNGFKIHEHHDEREKREVKREVSKRIQDSRGGATCQKKEKKIIKTSFVMKSVRSCNKSKSINIKCTRVTRPKLGQIRLEIPPCHGYSFH